MSHLLANLRCPNRYTKKIRCLDLEIEYDESNLLSIPLLLKQRQFAFANARSVIVDLGSENMNEKDMVQFLSPSLLCLELYGGYYTRWFLEQVKVIQSVWDLSSMFAHALDR